MNSKTFVLLVVVYFMALSVRQSFSLECYTCIGCGDPFDAKKHKDSKTTCSGSCQKLKVNDIVTRNCFPMIESNKCEEKDDNAICQCTSDLCNSALNTQISVLVILPIAAAYMLRRYVF